MNYLITLQRNDTIEYKIEANNQEEAKIEAWKKLEDDMNAIDHSTGSDWDIIDIEED
jgi:hypothetical protein